jgi:hypothetical protein
MDDVDAISEPFLGQAAQVIKMEDVGAILTYF